jgi:hypothetical protein
MISDARMRAHLLSTIHGMRNSNTGWVPVSDMNFGGLEPVDPGRIPRVSLVFRPGGDDATDRRSRSEARDVAHDPIH